MIVYVDVLIVLNFIIDFLCLALSGRLCGERQSGLRLALAALIGALSSLAIFLPPAEGWQNAAFKIALTALMALAAGGWHGARGYLKRLFMLFAVGFVFAGFALFLGYLTGGRAGFYHGGVYYLNVSAAELLAVSAAAYAGITLWQKLYKRSMAGEESYRVTVTAGGRTAYMRGVMDSQNRLIDLFSGTPVVVGPQALLREVMPPGLEAALSLGPEDADYPRGVRLIPCATVAGGDVLPAFRPERMVLERGGRQTVVEDVFIAVSAQLDTAADKKLLLNPALTGRETQIKR